MKIIRALYLAFFVLFALAATAADGPYNEVLYVTKDGELANARKMGDAGIYDFFKRVTAAATAKK